MAVTIIPESSQTTWKVQFSCRPLVHANFGCTGVSVGPTEFAGDGSRGSLAEDLKPAVARIDGQRSGSCRAMDEIGLVGKRLKKNHRLRGEVEFG